MADVSEDFLQPVVLDNGSGVIKCGFAGDELPKSTFPSYVGRLKYKESMAGAVKGDHFVGNKAEEIRGLLKIKYPIEHGVVKDWLEMENIWQHVYDELHVNAEDHPVLLTEPPHNPISNKEKAAEILFETFNVPALFFSIQAVLSLYATGRTTGVVLDSGDGVSHVVPIYEGFALPHTISRIDLAGRDITNHLQLLLRIGGYNFNSSSEKEVVRMIKEKCCYVAFDPTKEEDLLESEKSNRPVQVDYKLPDGNVITIGPERFRAPEVLFRPENIGEEYPGVHEILTNSILKSDLDMRSTFYSNIVLSGGSTLFPGFANRLLHEVQSLAPKDIKIKIAAPPERKYSPWKGGSILASLPTFKGMWINQMEYEESFAFKSFL